MNVNATERWSKIGTSSGAVPRGGRVIVMQLKRGGGGGGRGVTGASVVFNRSDCWLQQCM
jgi:hypothetical protein